MRKKLKSVRKKKKKMRDALLDSEKERLEISEKSAAVQAKLREIEEVSDDCFCYY
jgi:hypothetical protein